MPGSVQLDPLLRRAPPAALARDLLGTQVRLLGLLGSRAPLVEMLDALARYVESWGEGLLCSVMIADPAGDALRPGAAPSLPAQFSRLIDPVPIAAGRGSCGTAAALRERVIVTDIARSPLWADYAETAARFGLQACWSVPTFDDQGEVLGTLALYYREPRSPSADEIDLIEFAAALAGFVIQRHRDVERLRDSEERYRCLGESCPDAILIHDAGTLLYANAAARRVIGLTADEPVLGAPLATLLEAVDGSEIVPLRAGLVVARIRRSDGTAVPVEVCIGDGGAYGASTRVLICRDLTERLTLERAVIDAADRESARLASELHDGVCQQLAGIAMLFAAERGTEPRRAAADGAARMREAGLLIGRALTDARRLAAVMSPLVVSRAGLGGALHTLRDNVAVLYGVDVRLQAPLPPVLPCDTEAAEHLFRIAQEAVLNAVRHAHAARIDLAVAVEPGALELTIRDNGVGMPADRDAAHGLGLKTMRYRAARIGARLAITAREAGGTQIRVVLPLAG